MKSKSLITAALTNAVSILPPFDYYPPERVVAYGIPNPPKINQRKRRKQMRRVRPHGRKGGAA